MTKFVQMDFETEPADCNGVAVLKPVPFKTGGNTADKIALRTYNWISKDDRVAKLTLHASKASFDDMLKYRGDLYGSGAPFHKDNLDDKFRCAEGTFRDNNDCLPPLPPANCKDPQLPFILTDCKGTPAPVQGSAFLVKGTLERFPAGTVIQGLMLLFFQ